VDCQAAPCGIIGHPSVAEEFARSTAVVIATSVAQRDVADPNEKEYFIEGTYYRVKPSVVFKGTPPLNWEIYSGNDSGRFPLDRGKKYLLFVSPSDDDEPKGVDSVDACGNSGELSDPKTKATLKLVKALARQQAPISGSSPH
jgi:hypothetical protein